jgi:hypothetical protein
MVWVDESGFSRVPGLGRTSAPGGQTPVLRAVSSREQVSVMRGLTMDGRLYTLGREEEHARKAMQRFLTPVRPHVSEHLLRSGDGSPLQTGQGRTGLAAGGAPQLPVAPRPPDAPALTPEAGGWPPRQHGDLRHLGCRNRTPLRRALGRAMRRVRRRPQVMPACVGGAGLSLHNEVVHATLSKDEPAASRWPVVVHLRCVPAWLV